jgi:hypothetical protein
MAKHPTCLVCQKKMEHGFTLDNGFTGESIPRWYPGEPKELLLGSLARPKHPGCIIIAYRCPECKALRLYAPDPEET